MTATIALWSLLLQVFIPLLGMPPVQARAGEIPNWALAWLCHIELQADAGTDAGDPSGKRSPVEPQPVCPICLGLHIAGTFTQPAPLAVAMPRAQGFVAFTESDTGRAPFLVHPPAQARAPPATV
jgi:hypothetical protein